MIFKRLQPCLVGVFLFCFPQLLMAAPPGGPGKGGRFIIGMLMLYPLVIGIQVGILALSLLYAVLKPESLRRGATILQENFIKSFFIGLLLGVAYMLFLGIARRLIPNHGIRALLTVPVLCVWFIHNLMGFTMLANSLGEKIQANTGSKFAGSTFMAVLFGGTILLLTGLVPVFGLIILGLTGTLSLGMVFLTCFKKES